MNTNTNTNSISKENEILKMKLPNIAVPISIFVLFLVIITIVLLFSRGKIIQSPTVTEKTALKITYEVFLIIFVIIILFGLIFMLLPNSSSVTDFFKKTKSTMLLIVYTIFLIILFISLPSNIIDKYGSLIGPVSILISIIVFYFTFKNPITKDLDYNVTYERITTIIIFFCMLTLFILYYNIDPGNYIKNYMGYSMLLTILLSTFVFIYLIILITIPDTLNIPSGSSSSSLFDIFSKFSIYGSISFIVFLILLIIGIYTYPGGFLNDKYTSTLIIILSLVICIVWVSSLIVNLFPEVKTGNIFSSSNANLNTFKKSLLVLFGFIISGIFIAWLAYSIQNLSGTSGIMSFIFTLLLIIVIGALVYNLFSAEYSLGNSKKNNLLSLLSNSLFYIPCLVSNLSTSFMSFFSKPDTSKTLSSILLLVTVIILLFFYLKMPSLQDKLILQGGKLLINQPVYTDRIYNLASYEMLNDTDKFNYQYSISFWTFFDANPPNTNVAANKFTSIVNYGNKPNILYRSSTNTLMITMEQKGMDSNNNKLIDFDENGNRIILKTDKILLQKWNNIVINYSGGTLDIFLNNELIKSAIEVVPYMTLDTLSVGENEGYIGGICNLIYFNKPLTSAYMFYLYNTAKLLNPPVFGESNSSIISVFK
jgi:hypothetical protein